MERVPVLTKVITPLVVLVALNPETVWPKSKTVPPTEEVVKVVPVIAPESEMAPAAVKEMVLVVLMVATSNPEASA